MPWVLRGLRDGILTTRWPRGGDDYFDGFDAAITVRTDTARRRTGFPRGCRRGHRMSDRSDQHRTAAPPRPGALHPVRAVRDPRTGLVRLGARLRHGRAHPRDADRRAVDETDEALAAVRAALARRVRRLRRSVHIRHVDAGSDGSDEWEIYALTNPVYDVHRLGIFFTASPRHADILLATGVGTAGMTEPLRRTLDAMPVPRVVIAVGTDAISGGLIGGGHTGNTGISELVDVDVWVPGAPASPFSLLHAILLALGRLPQNAADAS